MIRKGQVLPPVPVYVAAGDVALLAAGRPVLISWLWVLPAWTEFRHLPQGLWQVKYLKNIVERDHRRIRRLVCSGWSTLAMPMRAQVLGISRDRHHRLRRHPEQQIAEGRFVLPRNVRDLGRQRAGDAEIADRRQVGFTFSQPVISTSAVALRTVPIPTANETFHYLPLSRLFGPSGSDGVLSVLQRTLAAVLQIRIIWRRVQLVRRFHRKAGIEICSLLQ
jgi:hypothetical protein